MKINLWKFLFQISGGDRAGGQATERRVKGAKVRGRLEFHRRPFAIPQVRHLLAAVEPGECVSLNFGAK
jgi:hypothetical protein